MGDSPNAAKDIDWQTFNFALGDTSGNTSINISGHSPSSSLLPMTSLHNDAAPGSEYLSEEEIEIRTLDAILIR